MRAQAIVDNSKRSETNVKVDANAAAIVDNSKRINEINVKVDA